MNLDGIQVLPEQLWWGGAVLALLDAALVLLLSRQIGAARFRGLGWPLAGAAAVFWTFLAAGMVWAFWEDYYQHIYPVWFRPAGVLLFVPLTYGALALAFHRLALRLPGNPLAAFCLLGAAESVLEHLWGIYGLGILDIPLLQTVGPAPILFFAVWEYGLYWCAVIGLAALLSRGWRTR